ncbi:unnamed protein product [Paramecium sonneborni]|uniref:Uncharacterized protein n=1 Tax=Paramecium sonneborni TaxID=65129 RepID=A0A8S1P2U4_9CILI|nr:unnamed protein product [Paramecium sonneborni]
MDLKEVQKNQFNERKKIFSAPYTNIKDHKKKQRFLKSFCFRFEKKFLSSILDITEFIKAISFPVNEYKANYLKSMMNVKKFSTKDTNNIIRLSNIEFNLKYDYAQLDEKISIFL